MIRYLGSSRMTHTFPDTRAAAAMALAGRLRQAAVVIRRHARGLTYHPMTGARPEPAPALLAALGDVEAAVKNTQLGADERAREEVAADGHAQVASLRAGHAAVEQAAQVVLAALEVLRDVLGARDAASVDAPYGHSAPVRHHPGALCTVVAERVEELARALETVTIEKANLARAGMPGATATPPAEVPSR
ncbi:MAG: hypothetical protein QN178_04845 [Armatimonadota bacterium]|nr:hypothetical protein [Armatimonadota bacterium]